MLLLDLAVTKDTTERKRTRGPALKWVCLESQVRGQLGAWSRDGVQQAPEQGVWALAPLPSLVTSPVLATFSVSQPCRVSGVTHP